MISRRVIVGSARRRTIPVHFSRPVRRRKLAKTFWQRVRCEMHYSWRSQGKRNRGFSSTSVAVSINSWESTTRTIGCVSPKPAGGAGSGSEILNDPPPTAVHARSRSRPRVHLSPVHSTPMFISITTLAKT